MKCGKNEFPHLMFHLLDVVRYHITVIRAQLLGRGKAVKGNKCNAEKEKQVSSGLKKQPPYDPLSPTLSIIY